MARVINTCNDYALMGEYPREKVTEGYLSDRNSLTKFCATRLYDSALSTLARLHIIGNPSQKLSFNPTFKASFRQAITGGFVVTFYTVLLLLHDLVNRGTHRSFGVPASDGGEEKRASVTLEALDAYAVERWEVYLLVLHVVSNHLQGSPSFADDLALYGLIWYGTDADKAISGSLIPT